MTKPDSKDYTIIVTMRSGGAGVTHVVKGKVEARKRYKRALENATKVGAWVSVLGPDGKEAVL